jgi:hypothetical protein
MRYAAGAVGWDHPEVRARVERLAAAEKAWNERRESVAAALVKSRRPRGEAVAAFGAHFTVNRWVCGKQAKELLQGSQSGECALVVTVAAPAERPLECSRMQLGHVSVAAIDRKGEFHIVWPICPAAELSAGELVIATGRADLVGLWLSDGKEVVLLGVE